MNVDVRRRSSWKEEGLLIGLVAGGVIGGAIGRSQESESDYLDFQGLTTGMGVVLGVLGGAVLGVLVAPGAKWEENVPLDHVHLSVGPTHGGGVGLSVSVAF
jgi:hypothetical protein